MSILERYPDRVVPITESGCWIWTGPITERGYGTTGHSGNPVHRESYRLSKGPIPPNMFVLHSCDVPLCVNPAHLRVGNQKDNMQDAVKRGRHTGGKNKLLTEENIKDIRSSNKSQSSMAKEYGVSVSCIHLIVKGKRYK